MEAGLMKACFAK